MVSVDDMDPFDVPILHHKESSSTLLFKHSEMWKRQIYCHNYRINVGPVATEVYLLNDGRNYSVAWPTLGLVSFIQFLSLYELYRLIIKQIFQKYISRCAYRHCVHEDLNIHTEHTIWHMKQNLHRKPPVQFSVSFWALTIPYRIWK